MSKGHNTYSREFKIEAVKMSYNSDQRVADLAEELGVSKSSLFRWRNEFGEDPDQAFTGRMGMAAGEEVETAIEEAVEILLEMDAVIAEVTGEQPHFYPISEGE